MTEKGAVVITGAGGCLGRSIARWWMDFREYLVLIDRDSEQSDRCLHDLEISRERAFLRTIDVTDPEKVRVVADSLPSKIWSLPPSLILAHGVSGRTSSGTPRLGGLSVAAWRDSIDVNLTSMVFTMQAFLPFMQSAGGGRIVLISSIAGLAASPTAALPYSVSKAAVAALPRLLAPQLAQINVLINAVAPSKFENESWAVSPYETKSYLDSVPLRRLASGAEVAALVGFLGSRSNTYITGQTIVHDGGRLCGWEPISV